MHQGVTGLPVTPQEVTGHRLSPVELTRPRLFAPLCPVPHQSEGCLRVQGSAMERGRLTLSVSAGRGEMRLMAQATPFYQENDTRSCWENKCLLNSVQAQSHFHSGKAKAEAWAARPLRRANLRQKIRDLPRATSLSVPYPPTRRNIPSLSELLGWFSANQEKSLHHIRASCICPGFMEINSEREGLKPRAKHIILTLWKHWKGSTEAKRKTAPRGTGKEAWPVIQKSILISLRSFLTGPGSSAIHRDCS